MTILCYHAVDPDWEAPLAVRPEAFAGQMEWLLASRRVLPLDEVARTAMAGGDRRSVAVTFDDGFESVYEHAFPVLARLRIPATVFLVARTVEGDATVDWVRGPATGVRTLDRAQILEMRRAGIRFGSHSFRHADLPALSPEACEADLRLSREVLEGVFGEPIDSLAYPRGLHDPAVRRAADRAGFRVAFTLPERREPVTALSIPRVGVYRGNDGRAFRLKTAPWYLGVRTSGLFAVLRRTGCSGSGELGSPAGS